MFDFHCHLNYIKDPKLVLEKARAIKMDGILASALSIEEGISLLRLKKEFGDILYISIGIHPEDTMNISDDEVERLIRFTKENKEEISAIGEVGLDYSYKEYNKERMISIFLRFVELSKELTLPIIIHCRQAYEDLMKILKEEKGSCIVLHCFSGSEGILKEALSRGYFISFATNICYTQKHPRLAEKTPLEKMILETDAPWLDPESRDSLTNLPWKIELSIKKISQIKNIPELEVDRKITENAKRILNIKNS